MTHSIWTESTENNVCVFNVLSHLLAACCKYFEVETKSCNNFCNNTISSIFDFLFFFFSLLFILKCAYYIKNITAYIIMIQYIDFMNLFYVYFVYIYIVDLPLIIPSNLFSTIQISVIYSSDSKHQWNQHILSTFILRYCFLSVVLVSAINYTMFLLLLSFFKLITAVFPFIYFFFYFQSSIQHAL